uniref:Uncharacterized protein n=1 Tax=Aegilops tauschii subsp. strangulata TaxID=200361 RepID=A0A453I299_AEGTS
MECDGQLRRGQFFSKRAVIGIGRPAVAQPSDWPPPNCLMQPP